jgi:hypothetical protein
MARDDDDDDDDADDEDEDRISGDDFDNPYDAELVFHLNDLIDTMESYNRPEDRDFYSATQLALEAIQSHAEAREAGALAEWDHEWEGFHGVAAYEAQLSSLYQDWADSPFYYDPELDDKEGPWKYHG